ncbi:Glucose-1-phosphate thymidylyltransferase [Desulfurococcus amylolyticus 1221n]|uniref:Glucose-1-phosphate thymidylyltransferase n=1 Tax=Desulfurococcus amylolyticus (strain DSM 18924 / JCM 16383 / VKM B-2413 / 1221n) TaxID=490899 RepID=B8D6C9_DESA1|nr:bifunctional sugar-1-phosphate nucleotidylyltransferase/acetyltransferase [Desulfurococcus amylolyticus]ACL11660.1 Glucose-1-phosphate thymidylyltransferase [Desulfurococcus amylolyticus 1221n]
MKAVILAAGNGIRLKPITETRPKPLIPILCKPLLDWHLDRLAAVSFIDEVVIVTGYMGDIIRAHVMSRRLPFKVRFVEQGEPRGTGDAVVKGIEGMGSDDDVLIIYSDIFTPVNIIPEIAGESGNIIVGSEVDNPSDYGVLINEGNYFKGVVEKPMNPPSRLVNAGIYKLRTRDILDNSDIKPSPRGELEFTDVLNNMSRRGVKIRIYKLPRALWIDIGKPWHVIEANKMALTMVKKEIKGRVIEPSHIIGEVYIGENSLVNPFTMIEGPAYIDREVEIGPNARIRPWSVICRGSKIGFSVEVKESIILENVHASHLTYIGDSIVCENVNLGAGTITANLRFDEATVKMLIKDHVEDTGRKKMGAVIGANVKTGVNVSLMPGVKIGSDTWIMPGSVVYRDVASNSIYYSDGRVEIKTGLNKDRISEK